MRLSPEQPLSDREIDQLEQFLLDDDGLHAPMDVSTLDGYLCAVLSGPKLIMPSEWMRWIWDMEKGEQTPNFRNETQAQSILSLLTRHANDIAGTLIYSPQDYEPLFYERETDEGAVLIVDEWCVGYVKGMSLDPAGWQPLLDEQRDWFKAIQLYGTESGWDQLKALVEAYPDSLVRHQAYVEQIAPSVRSIHAHWLSRRGSKDHDVKGQRQPIRKASEPRRNEPCPCGSGKKYKRCHGARGTLH